MSQNINNIPAAAATPRRSRTLSPNLVERRRDEKKNS
jgi:hypothetical protein